MKSSDSNHQSQFNLSKRELGERYESIAARYYEQNGFTILQRNWQAGHCEIDLVAKNENLLVFVEVKGGGQSMGHPAYRVDQRKREKLIQAAQAYLSSHNPGDRDIRFDVLVVMREKDGRRKIECFEGAITAE